MQVELPPLALLAGLAALGWLCCHRCLPLRWVTLPILVVALAPWQPRGPVRPEFWLLDVGQGLAAVLLLPGFTLNPPGPIWPVR